MKRNFFYCVLLLLLFMGCTSTHVKSFVDPSLQTSSVKVIAVFPMRNTAFSPGEALDIDRGITTGLHQKNPLLKLIGTSDAVAMLNQKKLVQSYDSLLYSFEHSGIPNTDILNKIGTQLGIDAILQGRLSDVSQQDGHWGTGAQVGQTSVTIRYTILSTQTGATLWEGIATANKKGGMATTKAPPLFDVTLLARNKVLKSIPVLGK